VIYQSVPRAGGGTSAEESSPNAWLKVLLGGEEGLVETSRDFKN